MDNYFCKSGNFDMYFLFYSENDVKVYNKKYSAKC